MEEMMGHRYIYEIRNMGDTSNVIIKMSLVDVCRITGLSYSLVCQCIERHKYVRGWIIERRIVLQEKKKQKGVVVFLPDGSSRHFNTKEECAKEMGISVSTIKQRIKDGKLNKNGNGYDYPV